MTNIRLPMAVCAAVADTLEGSHESREAVFRSAGVTSDPPEAPHGTKWKTWLFQVGQDPDADSLAILGNLIEEFMDVPPRAGGTGFTGIDPTVDYDEKRKRLLDALEASGLRYFRGGRVMPSGELPVEPIRASPAAASGKRLPRKPSTVEELLEIIVKRLPRAIHPLQHRRRGAQSLSFDSEYDIQDLLHALLRPWISDIRPEEFTPSYAGSSTRMDLLLLAHEIVVEMKRVRDTGHARKIGDELIVDIAHYRRHPNCARLWCVVYDPDGLIANPAGLVDDLEGRQSSSDGEIEVRAFVLRGDG